LRHRVLPVAADAAPQKGLVVLAAYNGRPVAGAVYFHYCSEAIFKFGASDRNHLGHRPNKLVLWEEIKKYSQKGFKVLDLGRTELENIGLRQFKKGWGSDEKKIFYFQYDLQKKRFVAKNNALIKSYWVFKHIPIPLMRLTGNLLYRHVG
jgi:lipid II:glycine glycyltransferase (peptidoglycan interpeptide bridge formation enzyme)